MTGATMSRRTITAGLLAAPVGVYAGPDLHSDSFRPEDFGARGDGRTNDTLAFAALSAALNQAGGGTVELRATTYVVGLQRRNAIATERFLFAPSPILSFMDCARDVTVRGNGAVLKAAAGLRYGVFDRGAGRPFVAPLPFVAEGVSATPYIAMIHAARCRGAVTLSDLTLDGGIDGQVIGGRWGDQGWQIPGSGIVLSDNTGDEVLNNVISRNHPLDGIIIDARPAPGRRRSLTRLVADRNGRQGCSLVGGQDYVFTDCRFTRTGRGPVRSSPGAGFDIEAEGGKLVRNIRFIRCTFSDNAGCGVVADTGPSSDVSFDACSFVGTTSWAAWPRKPRFSFARCNFVGAISNCYGGPVARDATRFSDCTFRDDPALSPTRQVYLGGGATGSIADLSTTANIRFDRCRFLLTHAGRLPWSTGAIYNDCTMRQRSPIEGYPRGTFTGRTTIVGKVDLAGSRFGGSVELNGRAIAPAR